MSNPTIIARHEPILPKEKKLMMKGVRGMRSLYGSELDSIKHIIDKFYNIGLKYNFKPIRVPLVEHYELFVRESDTETEISKQIYAFKDKKMRQLALRPEFTASIMREYMNTLIKSSTDTRFMTHGTLYRYDRPQKGRYREFHQFNVESIRNTGAVEDSEMIMYADHVLRALGIRDKVTLQINSLGTLDDQKKYQEVLETYLKNRVQSLSIDSQRRLKTNPLRILDSKDIIDQAPIQQAPKLLNWLSEESLTYFKSVKDLLDSQNIDHTINPYLVRGLDYYSETVFEFVCNEKGHAVIGGGRYDRLARQLGSSIDIPAVGLAAGLDRLALLLPSQPIRCLPKLTVIPLGDNSDLLSFSVDVLQTVRELDLTAEIYGQKSQFKRKLERALRGDIIIFIGQKELEENCVKIKNVETSEEQYISKDILLEEVSKMIDK